MDTAKAPVGRDFNEVGLPEAVGKHFVHVVGKVQQVLLVDGVPPLRIEGEVEEGLIKIEVLMEVAEAVLALLLLVTLVLTSVSILVVVGPLFLIGQNLQARRQGV